MLVIIMFFCQLLVNIKFFFNGMLVIINNIFISCWLLSRFWHVPISIKFFFCFFFVLFFCVCVCVFICVVVVIVYFLSSSSFFFPPSFYIFHTFFRPLSKYQLI